MFGWPYWYLRAKINLSGKHSMVNGDGLADFKTRSCLSGQKTTNKTSWISKVGIWDVQRYKYNWIYKNGEKFIHENINIHKWFSDCNTWSIFIILYFQRIDY